MKNSYLVAWHATWKKHITQLTTCWICYYFFYKDVTPPNKNIKNKIKLEYSKHGEARNVKKIPAVTIVAACNNALTGVGPSIASGNQTWNPICADLPIHPINKKKQIISTTHKEIPKKLKISNLIKGIK